MVPLQKLLGKEDKFFDLFEAGATQACESARALRKFLRQSEHVLFKDVPGNFVFGADPIASIAQRAFAIVDQLPYAGADWVEPEVCSAGNIQQNRFSTNLPADRVIRSRQSVCEFHDAIAPCRE